jgi:hypothetical protein
MKSNCSAEIRVCAARDGLAALPIAIMWSVFACPPAASQDLAPMLVECLKVKSAAARLACYDDVAKQARAQVTGGVARPIEPGGPQEATESTRETRDGARRVTGGLGAEPPIAGPGQKRAEVAVEAADRHPRGDGGDAGERELRARIASLAQTYDGRWIITLDSGEVWRQSVLKRYNLREGHDVRIYATRWGEDYRLTAGELNGFIQVERIK